MTDEYPIQREEADGRGRYVAYLPDGSVAELTYDRRDADTLVADHTGVPPAYRNAGLALKLVETAMADARREGTKIVPHCSYVVAQFRRHPEWSDLRAE